MPSYSGVAYLKKGYYAEFNLFKTLNFSKYYFTFPLSLQREAIYAKYRYYTLEDFANNLYSANEVTLGTRFDSVLLNDGVVPISFEYIYNDADFIQNKNSFRFFIDIAY
jgi:hypothetical protein